MAAEVLAKGGVRVTVYDAMPSAARKFLMAGRGGLNLTHSEGLPQFLTRYGTAAPRLKPAIEALPPQALRDWSAALGEPTFVGSSGRVFPQSFKASPLLRAWLRRLGSMDVQLALRHRWIGWDEQGRLLFETPDGQRSVEARATILALGGASWPKLGSDGSWVEILATKGIAISPLRPANCGFAVVWSDVFRDRFEGQPLKGVALSFGSHSVRGEAVITRSGIEGGASLSQRIAPASCQAASLVSTSSWWCGVWSRTSSSSAGSSRASNAATVSTSTASRPKVGMAIAMLGRLGGATVTSDPAGGGAI